MLGDAHGNVVYLWERECSIQRRHQKVIEEAPSPFLDEATRKAMGEQAVALAQAVRYQSAGTVEFVVGKDRSFFFLEMNTRLQVEHPVTEMITGLDLVELMIRVAAGEKLPFTQQAIKRDGWAMECRINAEDPYRGFLPSTGRLVRYLPPAEIRGEVRVDTGVYEGGEISMYYDSMIAKLITHGATRREAIDRMRGALDAFLIRGVASNVPFQAALMQHPRFVSGDFNTGFIAEEFPKGFGANASVIGDPSLMVVAGAMIFHRYNSRNATISGQMAGHEYEPESEVVVMIGRDPHAAVLNAASGGYDVTYRDQVYEVRSDWSFGQPIFRGTIDGQPVCMQLDRQGLKYRLTHAGRQVEIMALSRRAAEMQALMPVKVAADLSKFLLAPMPGLLTEIAVTRGQEVKAGDKLAVIEAMKMENVLRAERDGIVGEVLAKAGESLAVDQAIVKFQ